MWAEIEMYDRSYEHVLQLHRARPGAHTVPIAVHRLLKGLEPGVLRCSMCLQVRGTLSDQRAVILPACTCIYGFSTLPCLFRSTHGPSPILRLLTGEACQCHLLRSHVSGGACWRA
jgi:hypothetical protein